MTKREGIEVFQDLTVRHEDDKDRVRPALLNQLGKDWKHLPGREAEMRDDGDGGEDVIAFERKMPDRRSGVVLWLWEHKDGYRVSNIVPKEAGELGIAGYNDALQAFVDEVIKPAKEAGGLNFELTKRFQTIEDWVNGETATALTRFSNLANKSTGRSHPMDEKRWLEFVITAHRTNADLDAEHLARWLHEGERWMHEFALELASEYSLGRALLAQYDGSR